jgi:hypothetical protein
MLDPDTRAVLLDALRPPSGMVLDRAVGTTFTLDLETLLLAPLAFAWFDTETSEGGVPDPIALLEAVRRHAEHIDVFCQAGLIRVPPHDRPLLALLENSVHPIAQPRGGIFHPKTWAIRYKNPQSGESALRILVLSRNLTFDRSWDVIVRLDEGGGMSEGDLPGLLRWLPEQAVLPMADSRRSAVEELAEDIQGAHFEVPPGFDAAVVQVFGLGGDVTVPQPERILVMSPFVSDAILHAWSDGPTEATLVSTTEALDRLAETTLARYREILVLDPNANGFEGTAAADEIAAERTTGTLTGLHAKIVIRERGGRAQMVAGSANATGAGYGGNIEAVVQLEGPRRAVGIGALLDGETGSGSFRNLLVPYAREETEPTEPTDEERLVSRIERLGMAIAGNALRATVTETAEDAFELRLTSRRKLPADPDVTVDWRPITLPSSVATRASAGEPVDLTWQGVSFTALTGFFVFEISAKLGRRTLRATFVTVANLVGAPDDRLRRIVSAQLASRADVIRYLLFLLSGVSPDDGLVLVGGPHSPGDGHWDIGIELPLLETMVRALARNPESLDHVGRLLEDLQSRPELVPPGLKEVWDPIWQARQAMR